MKTQENIILKERRTPTPIYYKYLVKRNGENIYIIKEESNAKTISEITSNHSYLKAYINDINKLRTNYKNLITYKQLDNGKEHAIIKDYIYDYQVINYITRTIDYIEEHNLNKYLKDYLKERVVYLNNEKVLAIRKAS